MSSNNGHSSDQGNISIDEEREREREKENKKREREPQEERKRGDRYFICSGVQGHLLHWHS